MRKLSGKIALVTGGNSGIGLATAKQFVLEGAYVFITGRREGELAKAAQEIGENVTACWETYPSQPTLTDSSCRSRKKKVASMSFSPTLESPGMAGWMKLRKNFTTPSSIPM